MNGGVRMMAERTALLVVVAGVTILFGWVLSDFFMPVFAAVVLAILFHPLYVRIVSAIPRFPGIASAATLAVALLLIAVPIYMLGNLLAKEAIDTYQTVAANPQGYLSDVVAAVPAVPEFLQSVGISPDDMRGKLAEGAQMLSAGIFSIAAAATTGTIGFAVKLVVALYLMFFLVKDGLRIAATLTRVVPLRNQQVEALLVRFSSTVRAVVKGGLVVAVVQGVLGGVLFAIVGVPHAVLWGSVMGFLALVPLGGPALVWAPAALFSLATGHPVAALSLVLGGAFLVGTIDNILRPFLVGRDTEMPDALILLSVLGGLATFGPAGIIIGPVLAALFVSVWEMFAEEMDAYAQ